MIGIEKKESMEKTQSPIDSTTFAPAVVCSCPTELSPQLSIPASTVSSSSTASRRAIVTTAILFYINLLNYMDRSSISSITTDLENAFSINNQQVALLTTVFVCSYMIAAPLFGYLGDRVSRKYIMACGVTIWSINTYAGSELEKSQYWALLVVRSLVGIGEASFSIVAPTILGDLFVGDERTKALTLFNFAMPCGIGLGYVGGSQLAHSLHSWKWALRLTPGLGIIALLLNLFFVHEPARGEVERSPGPSSEQQPENPTTQHTYIADIKQIMNIRSFIWSTVGFTCVSFATGALGVWAPTFVLYAQQVHDKRDDETLHQVTYPFGIIVIVAGVVGNVGGAEWARRWRSKTIRSDSYVCGIGVLVATPCLFVSLWTANKIFWLSWTIMFIGCVFMFLTWTPTQDILLCVIPPSCRATAEAIQVLSCHVFGDAFSPLIVGAVSDSYVNRHGGKDAGAEVRHLAFLYSFYITLVLLCCGAGCYFITAYFLSADKKKLDAMKDVSAPSTPPPVRRSTNHAGPVLSTLECSGGFSNTSYSKDAV